MEDVRLGRSELHAAPISLATWPLADLADETTAVATIERARDLGVNLFDVAPAYDRGRSEALLASTLGDELREHRDDIVIATEGGLVRDGDLLVSDTRPAVVRADVDHTLSVLGIDAIDLYQVPWPDPFTPIEQTLDELSGLVEAGKVRQAGLSVLGGAPYDTHLSRRLLDALQVPSFVFQRGIDGLWLPHARTCDLGVLVGAPLADGVRGLDLGPAALSALPRGWSPDPRAVPRTAIGRPGWGGTSRPPTPRPATGFGRRLRPDPDRNIRHARTTQDALTALAAERELPLGDLVLAWTIAQPGVHVAIVGAGTPAQLQESVESVDLDLSAADLAAIDRIRAGADRAA